MKKFYFLLLLAAGCMAPCSGQIYLSGEVNEWSGSDAAYELTDADADGVYTLNLSLPEGTKLGRFKIVDNGTMMGTQNTYDYKLNSTETLALADASDAGCCDLADGMADHRNFDVFYAASTKTVTVISRDYSLYLRGALNGWNSPDIHKFRYENGVYSLDILPNEAEALVNSSDFESPGFKIASGDWSVEYATYSDDTNTVNFGEGKVLEGVSYTKNIYLAPQESYQMTKVTFNALSKELLFGPSDMGLYLRGDEEKFGTWNVVDNLKFSQSEAGNWFELDFAEATAMSGNFKVASSGWELNFGNAYGLSPVLKLEQTGAGDINLGESAPEATTLYFAPYMENGNRKGNLFLGLPAQVYLIGLNGDWNTKPISTALTQDQTLPYIYANDAVTVNESDSDVRIFDNVTDGDYGIASWGLGKGDGSYTSDLTFTNDVANVKFVKGAQDKILLPAGNTYSIRFNIFTGETSITRNGESSIVSSLEGKDDVKVVGGNGVITVSGADRIAVYTTSGALVSENISNVNVPGGIYIVKADNKVIKIVVK